MKKSGTWSQRILTSAMLLGYPGFGSAALPPDSALTIPNEAAFDELKIEGIRDVRMYNPYPEDWTVQELTGTWKRKKLDEVKGGSKPLTAAEIDAAAKEVAISTNAAWKEGARDTTAADKDRSLFLSEFTLPATFKPDQQSCLLVFETSPASDVYINGVKCAALAGSWVPAVLDISKAVAAGRNVVALSNPTGYTMGKESRIVLSTAAAYARRMLVNPDIQKSLLNVHLLAQNNASTPVAAPLRVEISPWGKKDVVAKTTVEAMLKPGETPVVFSVPITNPVYWTPDNPYLYEIRVFDKNGKGLAKDRFGFREFIAKGRHFYLNGQEIRLFGMQWNAIGLNQAFLKPLQLEQQPSLNGKIYHYAYLKGFKAAGLNSIRTHSGSGYRGRSLFEACDELGILHYDDWTTSGTINKQAAGPVDEHMAKEYAAREAWLYYGYNYPSTVMYSFGNELYGALTENANALYRHMKPLDLQNRPMCSSSGRIPGALLSGIKDDIDFGDDHSYFGSMVGSWMENREYFRTLKNRLDAMYGKDAMPLVNFELGGGFLTRYDNPPFTARINKIATTSPVDRAEYVKLAIKAGDWGWEVVARFPILQRGIRVHATDEIEVQRFAAENMRRIWELLRQEDILDGVGPHQASNLLIYGTNSSLSLATVVKAYPDMKVISVVTNLMNREAFIKTPGYYAMKRSYNPELISARWFDRNLIAGTGAVDTAIFVINDTLAAHDYTARVLFKDTAGKVLQGDTLAFGSLPANGLTNMAYRYPVAATLPTGEYHLELFLFRDGKRVGDNQYEVRVFAPKHIISPVQTAKKVAFYAGAGSSEPVLKDAQIKYDVIKDLKDLKKYQVLIIGAGALDETIIRGGDAIRQWVEQGGRLLCFEQRTGYIPWSTGMSIISARATEMADIIEPAHPAFAGMDQRWFDTWSGKGTLYSNVLSPLNEAAVAMGAAGYVMLETFAGTIMADIAISNGVSLVSAFDVTERYGRDAVATKLANNLVRYIVSDETKFSRPVKAGRQVVVLETDDCDLIDLKPWFNSSFIDEVASDGKGGWDDYGPDNDLRNMVVGRQLLAGVPFQIVDPRQNNDRSCIILQQKRLPHLAKSVEGIKVNGLYNALYFLHTSTCTSGKKDEPLYSFVVHFADGSKDELAIRQGVHIADWSFPDDTLPGSRLAWTGMAAGDRMMAGVFFTEWKNPKPQVKIMSVDFVGTGKNVPVLIAITGYKGSMERGWLAPSSKPSK